MPPKAKAHSAAQAASKKKSSAVEISHAAEQRIRAALKELDVPWQDEATALPTAGGSGCTTGAAALPSEEQLLGIYAELAAQGFQRRHVEGALGALPLPAITLETALDWLLLHLEPSDLPKRYASTQRAGAGGAVDVKHKAREATPQEAAAAEAEAEAEASAAAAAHAAAAAESRRRQEAEQAAAVKAAEEAKAKEEAQRRAWIMQYAEAGSSSEEEEEEVESDAQSAASDIEDWEVWGDPREIERRRAERDRQRMPREQRVALMAAEMTQAKAEAAAAKAAGSKDKQKACGQLIGQLRQEMAQLGLTDADLEAAAPASTTVAPAAAPATGPDADQPVTAAAVAEELPAAEGEDESAAGRKDSDAGGASPAAAASAECSDDEGPGLGFDLFGDGSALEEAEVVKSARNRVAAAVAAALKPWGAASGGNGKKKGKGSKLSAAPKVEVQQPKALLQQHCQRSGWAAPRFERLAHGGMRLAGGGYRYSVAVDASAGAGAGAKGPKRRGAAAAAAAVAAGPRSYSLREADDGWERIEDAQNAAATRALYELAAGGDAALAEAAPPVWAQLPPSFQEVWLTWQEEGEVGCGGGGGEEESEEQAAARRAFVQQLLVAQADVALQQQQQQQQQAAEEEGSGGTRSWHQQQLNIMAAAVGSEEQQQQRESARLAAEQAAWRESQEGRRWAADRAKLPVTEIREGLLAALERNDVCVVSGETGSGKTTQVPQYILEAAIAGGAGATCSIVCTQPRRIAAISVAERVAAERGEAGPGERGCKVGYHVRLDAAASRNTRLLFCTTGILLRRLGSDPALAGASHVLVDEVHERTLQGDFLMALLRDIVAVRRAAGRPLKVVLMSATLDSALFADYFSACSVLHAQGRTFPVEQRFLEDCYQATGYILDADSPAALRPRWDRRAQKAMAKSAGARHQKAVVAGWGDAADTAPLNPHFEEEEVSGYSPNVVRNLAILEEDRLDFELLEQLVAWIDESEEGKEGAILVFLPGKLKERRYDAGRGMSLLVEDWVSAASAKQRLGRAGRVRPGICYGLYTRARFEHRMRRYQQPEMVRVPLEELVLQIHLLKLGKAGDFLSRVLQPPPEKSVTGAVRMLQEVGALTVAEELTPLGHHLAALPVDARVGKLLLLGASLGCLSPALTIAACLSYKSPYAGGAQADAAERARAALAAPGSGTVAAGQQSDHLLLVAAVDGWLAARAKSGHKGAQEYSRRHYLSEQTLDMLANMRGQFAAMLADIGFVAAPGRGGRGGGWMDDRSAPCNRYAAHPAVVKAVLLAALYPNVAVMEDEAVPGKRPGWHDGGGEVAVHPSSICHPLESQLFQRPYLVYLEKVRTSRAFIRDCTPASPLALLLFGGALAVAHDSSYVSVDGWLRVRAPPQTAVLVKRLRQALDALLRRKVQQPGLALEAAGGGLVEALVELLNHEEAAARWDR